MAAASSKAMCQYSVPAGPVVGPASEKKHVGITFISRFSLTVSKCTDPKVITVLQGLQIYRELCGVF